MTENRNHAQTVTGIALASFSVLVWGITFVSTRYLLVSFSALEILVLRFVLAYAALWAMYPHVLHLSDRKHELMFALCGLSGVTVYQFLENIAILYTSASNVSIIVSVCPMFTAVTAQLFLKEKHITRRFTAGFIVAITGIALVTFNGTAFLHFSPKGDAMACAAAVCWGFYSLFVSRVNSYGYPAVSATRRIFFWALVCMIPLVVCGALGLYPSSAAQVMKTCVLVSGSRYTDPLNWVNLVFLGVVASALCFTAWNRACAYLGTVRVTAGIYLIPVVTIVFAFFALGEKITLMGAWGAALTIAGLVVSEWKGSDSRK